MSWCPLCRSLAELGLWERVRWGSGLPSLPKLKPGTSRPMEETGEVLQAPQHVAVLLEKSPVRL